MRSYACQAKVVRAKVLAVRVYQAKSVLPKYLGELKMELEEKEKAQIRISVRNLVEFVMRSGDIDNKIGRASCRERV